MNREHKLQDAKAVSEKIEHHLKKIVEAVDTVEDVLADDDGYIRHVCDGMHILKLREVCDTLDTTKQDFENYLQKSIEEC